MVFILDNLAAHKCSLIMRIFSLEDKCKLMCTPSCSPQLSPIENMFSLTKRMLKGKIGLTKPKLYALEVSKIMFGFS